MQCAGSRWGPGALLSSSSPNSQNRCLSGQLHDALKIRHREHPDSALAALGDVGDDKTVCGDLHGVSQSTVSVIIKTVSQDISSHLHEWITFPNTQQAFDKFKESFYNVAKFP
ncbi:hypothetical protein J437_LFUL018330, partial [Ladona fulva]